MRMVLCTDDQNLDRMRYNAPVSPEIAAILPETLVGCNEDVAPHHREGGPRFIIATHRLCDPLPYRLPRPTVSEGWTVGFPHTTGRRAVTENQFVAYRLMARPNEFLPLNWASSIGPGSIGPA